MRFIFLFVTLLGFLSHCRWTSAESSPHDAILKSWWTKVATTYPKYAETLELLRDMEKTFPDLVHVYTVGKSVQGREMWVLEMSTNVTAERTLLKPPMKIVANMHGDETIGRALTLMLAVDMLEKFENGDPR